MVLTAIFQANLGGLASPSPTCMLLQAGRVAHKVVRTLPRQLTLTTMVHLRVLKRVVLQVKDPYNQQYQNTKGNSKSNTDK